MYSQRIWGVLLPTQLHICLALSFLVQGVHHLFYVVSPQSHRILKIIYFFVSVRVEWREDMISVTYAETGSKHDSPH